MCMYIEALNQNSMKESARLVGIPIGTGTVGRSPWPGSWTEAEDERGEVGGIRCGDRRGGGGRERSLRDAQWSWGCSSSSVTVRVSYSLSLA